MDYHFTEILPSGEIKCYDMCKKCGWEFVKDAYEPKKIEGIDKEVQDLFSYIVDLVTQAAAPKPKNDCRCGMSARELEEKGRFGCPHCYDHFSEYIKLLVFPYHNANQHIGKRPNNTGLDQLKLLKLQLAQAIEVENYERAQEINNKIKSLTKPHSTSVDQ